MLPGLFDSDPEAPEAKQTPRGSYFSFSPDKCPHKNRRKTLTIWPGETVERMTATCDDCGKVTGYYYDL